MTESWEPLAPLVSNGPMIPMPAVYIDRVMPFLTDAEWRVLCVIIRQTLGWADPKRPGQRKERDWINQSQFRERTGKSRDSISRAVAGLIQHGLIIVESEKGESLHTPRSRQQAREKLYYRLRSISTHQSISK